MTESVDRGGVADTLPAAWPGPRRRLANRRPGVRGTLTWIAPHGQSYTFEVVVGFYADGRAGEVFASGPKTGTDLRFLIEDGCVLVSNLLQMGRTLPDLMNRLGGQADSTAASAIGAIVRFAAEIESAHRAALTSIGAKGTAP